MNENGSRNRNILITILVVIIVVGGAYWVADNFYFGSNASDEIVAEEICVDLEGQAYQTVCGTQEQVDTALAQMGIVGESPIVTVTIGGVEVTGTLEEISALISAEEADPTPVPTSNEVDSQVTLPVSYVNNDAQLYTLEIEDYVTVTGIPEASYPVRWGNGVVQDNNSPLRSAAWILADPGVIGSDDCGTNQSCVEYQEARVTYLQTTEVATYTCPAGGYFKATFGGDTLVEVEDNVSFWFEANDDTNNTLLLRCSYDEAGDNNDVITITTGQPGRVHVTRYPVDAEFGGFFSYVHLLEDLVAGHGELDGRSSDNCGSSGCNNSFLTLGDLNHGTVGVYTHHMPRQGQSAVSGFEMLYSNAHRPE